MGDKLATRVKRELVQQTGLPYGDVNHDIKVKRAGSDLTFEIQGSGKYYGLSHFKPKQTALGVVARPWFAGRLFPHTFLIASLGNNVFKRIGKGRGDIEKVYGPSIPREMERDQIPPTFVEESERSLPEAIDRKLAQFMPF